MYDPYSVLGVTRSASEDDIKKAYRNLSRKYHPDANVNNPNKAQAEEKFKEIQQAYKQIMDEKEGKGGYAGGSSYGSSTYGGASQGGYYRQSSGSDYEGYEDPFADFFRNFGFGGFGGSAYRQNTQRSNQNPDDMHLQAVANFINSGQYQQALNLLSSIEKHDARWYYYSAIANSGMGNNVQALEHARTAAAMEPGNQGYARLVQQLSSGGSWYANRQGPFTGGYGTGGNVCNRVCLSYLACSCCCGGGGCFFPMYRC